MTNKLRDKAKEWLIWSQKYTKTDMLYLARGSFWTTLSYVSGTILSFILALAFANLLPKETFGIYKYAFSLIGILSIFSLSGMAQAIIRSVARGKDKILKSAFKFQLRWSFPFILIANGVAIYYWIQGNHTISISLLILSFSIPLIQSFHVYGYFLTGKKDFKMSTALGAIGNLITSASLITTRFITDSVLILVTVYCIANIIASVISYFITFKKYGGTSQDNLDKETIGYGTSLSIMSFAGALAQQIDKVLIFKFAGSIELANYAIATALPDRIKSFIKSSVAMVFPKLAEKSIDDFKHTVKMRVLQGMVISFLIASAYIVAAPFLFRIFMPKYMNVVLFSQLLSLANIFLVPTFFIGFAIESQKLLKSIYLINIITVSSRLSLYAVFGYLWGPLGIVISRVIATILLFFVHLFFWHIESNYLFWAKKRDVSV